MKTLIRLLLCTVCPDLSARKLRIITVNHAGSVAAETSLTLEVLDLETRAITVDSEMFEGTLFSLIFGNLSPPEFRVLANIVNTNL